MTDLDALLDRIEEKQKVEGQIEVSTSATSLDFLQAIYLDPNQSMQRRMRAAAAALPFEHPKTAVIARVREEDLAERLMRALNASGKVINGRAMQILPAPKADAGLPTDEVLDHSKPFVQNTKRRFRRF